MPFSRCAAALGGLALAITAAVAPASAGSTQYPLTIQNCGVEVTFAKAPQRAVALGQNTAEILLLLGLEDRLAASAFWPNKVLPDLAAANAKVKLLTVEMPTLESILGAAPDLVAAQLPTLLGPDSKVAKREDLAKLGIPAYLSPGVCVTRNDTKDGYGSRAKLWNMDLLYQEIDELSRIFDVAERGQKLIADFKAREAALKARVGDAKGDRTFLFWFSSASPQAEAYVGGKNAASGYIADLVGGRNAVTTEAEWPTVSWEGIIGLNPTVIVVASLDRNRWDLDKAESKIKFLKADPAVSQLDAVKMNRIIVMDGQAMNPTIRTIYGAEQVAQQLTTLGLMR